jgi:hypothetical protein
MNGVLLCRRRTGTSGRDTRVFADLVPDDQATVPYRIAPLRDQPQFVARHIDQLQQ